MNKNNPIVIYPQYKFDGFNYELSIRIGVMLKIMAMCDDVEIGVVLDKATKERKHEHLILLITEIFTSQNENVDIDSLTLDDLRHIKKILPEMIEKSFPDIEEKEAKAKDSSEESSYYGWDLFALKELNQTEKWLHTKTPRYINGLIEQYIKVYGVKDDDKEAKKKKVTSVADAFSPPS